MMHSAAGCASCTVADVFSGCNGMHSVGRGKCYACCGLAMGFCRLAG